MSRDTPRPRVTVVVLTWNGLEDLTACLESFACVEYDNRTVVVVDNASEDATAAVVRERFPSVTLIVNGSNLGYVGGNNVGMRYALEHGADYIFILNNDTKMTPTVLDRLVDLMQGDRRIAVSGAKNLLMANPSCTWGKYGVLNWGPMLAKCEGRYQVDHAEPSPKDVDWVIGNGCLMRREALQRVGLFDENFFQVHEDIDWCVRARRLGYRVVYVDDAAIFHKGAASADPTRPVLFSYGYFLGRNPILFARKHASPLQWGKLLLMMLGGLLLRIAFSAFSYSLGALGGQLRFVYGVIDGFRGRLRPELAIVHTHGQGEVENSVLERLRRWLGA
jgi:GT2 family glycosyltransferase